MNPSEDTRNLVDKYKGLSNEEIIADLDKSRISLEVAIENTDKYLHIDHFATVDEFVDDARARNMKIVAVDNNRPEAKALAKTKLSANSILVFGSESDGISQELLDRSDQAFYIEQLGSTRSINVGCASAVAMYEAVRQLGLLPKVSRFFDWSQQY